MWSVTPKLLSNGLPWVSYAQLQCRFTLEICQRIAKLQPLSQAFGLQWLQCKHVKPQDASLDSLPAV